MAMNRRTESYLWLEGNTPRERNMARFRLDMAVESQVWHRKPSLKDRIRSLWIRIKSASRPRNANAVTKSFR